VERDAPGALASARAAPNKLTTNLTLSSAERRRSIARTGAPIQSGARVGTNARQYDRKYQESQAFMDHLRDGKDEKTG